MVKATVQINTNTMFCELNLLREQWLRKRMIRMHAHIYVALLPRLFLFPACLHGNAKTGAKIDITTQKSASYFQASVYSISGSSDNNA